jgi:leader peptidase (prepilin peptidase)/N-methyltransferase
LNLTTFALWIAVFVALTSSVVDLEWKKIPNRLTYPAAGSLLVLAIVRTVRGESNSVVETSVIGASIFVFFSLVNIATQGGFGLGDAKLAAVAGMALSPFGWVTVVDFLMVSFVIGGGVGVALLLSGRKGRKDTIPFGPFLAVGFIALALVA